MNSAIQRPGGDEGSDLPPEALNALLKHAELLLRRYHGLRNAHQSPWSLLNSTWIRASRHVNPRDTDLDHLVRYLAKAMLRVLFDRHKRGGSAAKPTDSIDLAEISTPDSEADALVIDEREQVVRAGLAELAEIDPGKALVLTLRVVEDVSWEDTAAILETTIDVARGRFRFACAWLRQYLRRRGLDAEGALGS